MNKISVGFEFEKSPLHTFVYGAAVASKTYFDRQYLMLYQESCFADQGTCFIHQDWEKEQKQKREQKQEQNNEQDYEQN